MSAPAPGVVLRGWVDGVPNSYSPILWSSCHGATTLIGLPAM